MALGYRRIIAEVDTRHLIARKFLERCGFKIEGILRKHRIVNRRNRDTVLFVFLNSDWDEVMIKLKRLLGIELRPKGKNVADVDKPENIFCKKAAMNQSHSSTEHDSAKAKKGNKSSRKKKRK